MFHRWGNWETRGSFAGIREALGPLSSGSAVHSFPIVCFNGWKSSSFHVSVFLSTNYHSSAAKFTAVGSSLNALPAIILYSLATILSCLIQLHSSIVLLQYSTASGGNYIGWSDQTSRIRPISRSLLFGSRGLNDNRLQGIRTSSSRTLFPPNFLWWEGGSERGDPDYIWGSRHKVVQSFYYDQNKSTNVYICRHRKV